MKKLKSILKGILFTVYMLLALIVVLCLLNRNFII